MPNKIMIDLVDGVTALNKCNIIHTDIKPSNLLIRGLNPIFVELFEIAKVKGLN